MTYIYRTLIVPAEHAPLARSLAAHLAGPPGDGVWVVGLSEDGSEPADIALLDSWLRGDA